MLRCEPGCAATSEQVAAIEGTHLRAVSLFCGAGGFCEGARLAGFDIVAAVEADRDAGKTHAANFPNVALHVGDIACFLRKRLPMTAPERSATTGIVDLVFGGPPCQGFSQIGPRDPDDPRNLLYREFFRVIRRIKPSAFVMENVPNMLSISGGQFRDSILRACRSAGYGRTIIIATLASDYGVPQDRRRIFIVGLRDGLKIDTTLEAVCLPKLAEFKCAKPVTVWQAISDLPAAVSLDDRPVEYPSRRPGQPPAYQRFVRLDYDGPLLASGAKLAQLGGPAMLHNHHTKGMEDRRRTIVGLIQPGMNGANLPKQLWKGTRGHKWRRLNPDKPSYTILAQMSRDLSEWIHPAEDRWITVREAARLQSFHDGFVFHGSEYQQLKQVGNAVPPLLGLAIASAVKALLRSVRKS